MKDYIFIKSQSGDRTNILSNFEVMDREKFIETITKEDKRSWREDYRYSRINGRADNIKGMSLQEFEEVFHDCLNLFSPELVTRVFRKEISEVYGEHKLRKEKKNISQKDLVKGGLYLDAKGDMHLYLGDVTHTTKQVVFRYRRRDDSELSGKGWLCISEYDLKRIGDGKVLEEEDYEYLSVLKTNRKVTDFTGRVFDIPSEVSFTRNGRWRDGDSYEDQFKETIKFY